MNYTRLKKRGVDYLMVLLLSLVVVFVLTVMLGTYYVLDGAHLKYRCSFIRGEIALEKIQELTVGKSMWTGLKPATARNGIVIKYGKYGKIYISPDSNESFVKQIKKLNPKIKISV